MMNVFKASSILGINHNNNFTENEINKAYRKKALSVHPDKGGGSEEKFKELQQAYEFLLKKKKIEKFGKTATCQIITELTLQDIATEKEMNLIYIRQSVCECFSYAEICQSCKGSKKSIISLYNVISLQSNCISCNGKGVISGHCNKCNNYVIEENFNTPLRLKKENCINREIILEGVGNEIPFYDRGDVLLKINIKPDKEFKLENDGSLYCEKTISLKQALCGFTIKINHPSGEIIEKCISSVSPYHLYKISNKGMLIDKPLMIKYNIIFEKLTEEQKEKLQNIL